MFINNMLGIKSNTIKTLNISNPILFKAKNTKKDSFEKSTIKKEVDKNGDIKNIIQTTSDGKIARKGKMIENQYHIQKLLVTYPQSKKNYKELHVIDNYLNYSYKLTRENKNKDEIYLAYYNTKQKNNSFKDFPEYDNEEQRCEVIIDKKMNRLKEISVMSNGRKDITLKYDRDKSGRMIKETTLHNGEISAVTNITYNKDNTIYDSSNRYFNEKMIVKKDDGLNIITIRKDSDGTTITKYKEDEYLEQKKYDNNDNIISDYKAEPYTFDLISDKQYNSNGELIYSCDRKYMDCYEVKNYENGKITDKYETDSPMTIDLSVNTEEPTEYNDLAGIINGYKIRDIYPVETLFDRK